MNEDQYRFLEQLATRIPRLFEAIRQGNVKSEYIIGVRRIGSRHVRLKLVAEVVDPGANPLESHSQLRAVRIHAQIDDLGPADAGGDEALAEAPAKAVTDTVSPAPSGD